MKLSKTTIQAFIEANTSKLVPGGVITEAELCEHFDITLPNFHSAVSITHATAMANAFTLDKAKAYTSINSAIARSGLVIKQQKTLINSVPVINYHVQTQEKTEATVASYREQAKIKTAQARRLQAGIKAGIKANIYANPLIPGIES